MDYNRQARWGIQFTIKVEGTEASLISLTPSDRYSYSQICVDRATVTILPDFFGVDLIGPGQEIGLGSLEICLPNGTEAGTYNISIENPRIDIIDDLNAHIPATSSGVVQVQSPVTGSCPKPQPSTGSASPPPSMRYILEGPEKLQEGMNEFTVALYLTSYFPVVSCNVALDFNENILSLIDVSQPQDIAGVRPTVYDVVIGPSDGIGLMNSTESGYLALQIKLSDQVQESWKPQQRYKLADLKFRVIKEEPVTLISLRVVGPGNKYSNRASYIGSEGERKKRSPRLDSIAILLEGESTYPLVQTPEEVQVTYRLSSAVGRPGESGIPIRFFTDSNTAFQGFAMTFRYDRKVLRCDSFTSFAHVFGEKPDFVSAKIWAPKNPDLPHGVYLAIIADLEQKLLYFPQPEEPVAEATFTILLETPEGTEAELIFDNKCCGTPPVENMVVFGGRAISPDLESTKVEITQVINGKVKVLGEVSIFLRGDVNFDNQVDIADAVYLLGYLFGGLKQPTCLDAADANDDGRVNIADPVTIIMTLFTPAVYIQPPYPDLGEDPTPDDGLGPCYW